jgi:hypothetical protein
MTPVPIQPMRVFPGVAVGISIAVISRNEYVRPIQDSGGIGEARNAR